MATGKAPISGSIAIVLGVLAVTLLVIAIVDGVSWSTVVGAFLNFKIFVMAWCGAKKQDWEYQERMERLEERLKEPFGSKRDQGAMLMSPVPSSRLDPNGRESLPGARTATLHPKTDY